MGQMGSFPVGTANFSVVFEGFGSGIAMLAEYREGGVSGLGNITGVIEIFFSLRKKSVSSYYVKRRA